MKIKKAIIIAFLFVLLFSIFTLSVFAYDYYIVNESTGKYHKPSCSYLPDESNSYEISSSSNRLNNLSPCGHCKPKQVININNNKENTPKEENVIMTPEIIISLLFSALITASSFLFVPFIIRITHGRISKGPARAIAIFNAILVEAFFTVISYISGAPDFNFAPAVLWGFVGYGLIRDKYS